MGGSSRGMGDKGTDIGNPGVGGHRISKVQPGGQEGPTRATGHMSLELCRKRPSTKYSPSPGGTDEPTFALSRASRSLAGRPCEAASREDQDERGIAKGGQGCPDRPGSGRGGCGSWGRGEVACSTSVEEEMSGETCPGGTRGCGRMSRRGRLDQGREGTEIGGGSKKSTQREAPPAPQAPQAPSTPQGTGALQRRDS